jgi:hypothetical protein
MKKGGANPFLILINLPVRHTRYGDPPKGGEEQAPLGQNKAPKRATQAPRAPRSSSGKNTVLMEAELCLARLCRLKRWSA